MGVMEPRYTGPFFREIRADPSLLRDQGQRAVYAAVQAVKVDSKDKVMKAKRAVVVTPKTVLMLEASNVKRFTAISQLKGVRYSPMAPHDEVVVQTAPGESDWHFQIIPGRQSRPQGMRGESFCQLLQFLHQRLTDKLLPVTKCGPRAQLLLGVHKAKVKGALDVKGQVNRIVKNPEASPYRQQVQQRARNAAGAFEGQDEVLLPLQRRALDEGFGADLDEETLRLKDVAPNSSLLHAGGHGLLTHPRYLTRLDGEAVRCLDDVQRLTAGKYAVKALFAKSPLPPETGGTPRPASPPRAESPATPVAVDSVPSSPREGGAAAAAKDGDDLETCRSLDVLGDAPNLLKADALLQSPLRYDDYLRAVGGLAGPAAVGKPVQVTLYLNMHRPKGAAPAQIDAPPSPRPTASAPRRGGGRKKRPKSPRTSQHGSRLLLPDPSYCFTPTRPAYGGADL
eukprot:TRINITY_DN19633_c0_g1_i1.p2 TRINITY_DN19633_c0_g1~~TRINITY_DN19633_c0_g1_i1.p2  ORF type:complete len:453 (+),score=142.90 TRINITY_DN19633_c0_g1_i1:59-1417(+)